MNDETLETESDNSIWIRGLYMLLFMLLYSVAEFVLAAVVLVQFGYRIFNEERHPRLLALGAAVASYIYQVMRFLSFNTEVMPYPFSDWPEGEAADSIVEGEVLPHQKGSSD
ncbi:MAG: DUF4389 domain-containing protein [Pseudomonadota bacterium]